MQEDRKVLFDSFGRRHNYLRISLTDKCNFRCTYCMPRENMKFMPDERLMSANEIIQLSSVFKKLGVERIRFTGGEPTLRKDFFDILKGTSRLGFKLSVTTNALLLDECLSSFREFGLNDINVSIDSIDQDTFFRMAKRNVLEEVMKNILLARSMDFNVKLNVVVVRKMNDREITDILTWSAKEGMPVRFIEYMPFFGNDWDYQRVVKQDEILNIIGSRFEFEEVPSEMESTSTNYFIKEIGGHFGIIPTVSNSFCEGCNRIRLTADGKVKNCLFSNDESDLLSIMRQGGDIEEIIRKNIVRKKFSAAGRIDFAHENARADYSNNRSMVSIGG